MTNRSALLASQTLIFIAQQTEQQCIQYHTVQISKHIKKIPRDIDEIVKGLGDIMPCLQLRRHICVT